MKNKLYKWWKIEETNKLKLKKIIKKINELINKVKIHDRCLLCTTISSKYFNYDMHLCNLPQKIELTNN